MKQLAADVTKLGIQVDRAKLEAQRQHLKLLLYTILDGVKLQLSHPKVASCEFGITRDHERGTKELGATLEWVDDLHGVLDWPKTVGFSQLVFFDPEPAE